MSRLSTTRFASALLATTLMVGAGGLAFAQSTPAKPAPVYDPAQLPELKGKVAQYTLTPRGEVDGFILADGTEVHTNPSLSTELVFAVHPGDAVTIHGLKAKATPMVAAASVTNDATGTTVSRGMGRWSHDRATTEAQGTVKEILHEARGEVNGVLLDNGAVVRLPPAEAKRLAATLAVGQPLVARGEGVSSVLGTLVMARQIGPDASKLVEVAAPHAHFGMMMHQHPGHDQGKLGQGPMDANPPPKP
jgi:hypothetical protein